MTTRTRLVLNVYASALMGDDGRTLAAIEGMERALPGLGLAWEVSKEGQLVALPRRDVWLAEAAARGEFPLVCKQVIADQTGPKLYGPEKPPRGLPALKLPEAIPAPELPRHLGWLNYGSAAAAKAIGFPEPARDAELLTRARRTPSGGWVVQLTDAPLDLDNPAHLGALKRAYERFPELGGRVAP